MKVNKYFYVQKPYRQDIKKAIQENQHRLEGKAANFAVTYSDLEGGYLSLDIVFDSVTGREATGIRFPVNKADIEFI